MRLLDFNIFNMPDRLKDTGDLFGPVLGKGIDLRQKQKQMEAALKTRFKV